MSLVQVKGLSELQKEIDLIPNKTMAGIKKGADLIYEKSQPYVPVDTGRLKKSGAVTEVQDGYQIRYYALNPKNKYNYAPIQHENMQFHHNVGSAKYLEKPIKENMEEVKKLIIEEVSK